MAPRRRQLPTRSSSRLSKPTERKRAQSLSISATPRPSKKIKRTKKTKKTKKEKPVSPPPAQHAEPVLVEEEDEDIEEEVEDEDAGSSTPPLARFTSVWKAVAAGGKETLPGTKSAVFNVNDLFLFQLEAWRDQTLSNLLPRKFTVSQ